MKFLLLILTLCFCLDANDLLNLLSESDKKRVIIATANCFKENPNIHRQVLELERRIESARSMNDMFALKSLLDSIGYDIGVYCGEYQNGALGELSNFIISNSGTTKSRYSLDFVEMLIYIANNIR